MKHVREAIRKDGKLKELISIEGMIKKVVDYLLNVQKNEPRKQPEERYKAVLQAWNRRSGCTSAISTFLGDRIN